MGGAAHIGDSSFEKPTSNRLCSCRTRTGRRRHLVAGRTRSMAAPTGECLVLVMMMIAAQDHAFTTGNSIAAARVVWVDASKGLAIILMVFGHVLGGAV